MSKKKKVVVIGAGPSGIPSIKSCLEEGLDVICFEKKDSIGGIWNFREGRPSPLTPGTLMNSNKLLGSYSDFPAPAHFPIYLTHRTCLEYLNLYADKFDLHSRIRLQHTVTAVSLLEDGRWEVKVTDPSGRELTEVADGVMVCVGHTSVPNIPDVPGKELFEGKVIHSHDYHGPEDHRGERVLVVGGGNTAGDVIHELSKTATEIYMTSRSGFLVLPRFMRNSSPLPSDDNAKRRFNCFLLRKIPKSISWSLLKRSFVGNSKIDFNMRPDDNPLDQRLIVNDHLSGLICRGRVKLKREIQSFTKTGVVLDGEEIQVDAVIFATGYNVTLPILPELYISTESLYKLILPIALPQPTLGIIGMFNSLGPFFPTMEMQARWFVQVFIGNIKLPSPEKMLEDRKKILNTWINEKQYGRWQNLCIEPISYNDDLARQMKVFPNHLSLILRDPVLYICCHLGPALPFQYRLTGPHSWPNARQVILEHPCNKSILQISTPRV